MSLDHLITFIITGYAIGKVLGHIFYKYEQHRLEKITKKNNSLIKPYMKKIEDIAYPEDWRR